MKRTLDANDSFISINLDDKYSTLIKKFVTNSNSIEYYKITEKSFTNISISQFIRDLKRWLITKYENHDFKFIKSAKTKPQIETTLNEIQTYFNKNNLDINISNSFINMKIVPFTENFSELNNLLKGNNDIFEIYKYLKIIYSKNNLSVFASTLSNKKGKIKDKQHAIELITNKNAWSDYIDYQCNNSDFKKKDKFEQLNKIYNKQLMNKLFIYYKNQIKNDNKQLLRKYFIYWRNYKRQCHRDYVKNIDITNLDGLTKYLDSIKLD
tara:strand:- start:150 stop:950 length:801 start_codon:yes stop_codon:yes gene_type:complete